MTQQRFNVGDQAIYARPSGPYADRALNSTYTPMQIAASSAVTDV